MAFVSATCPPWSTNKKLDKILFTAQGILFLELDRAQVPATLKLLAYQPSYNNKGYILTHYQVLLVSKALGFSPAIRFCFPTSPKSQWPQKGICYGLTSPPVQASQLLPLCPLLCMYSGKNLVESSELCFTAVCLCTEARRLPDPLAKGVLRMSWDFYKYEQRASCS